MARRSRGWNEGRARVGADGEDRVACEVHAPAAADQRRTTTIVVAIESSQRPTVHHQQPTGVPYRGRLTLLTILSKFTQNNEHGGQPGI